MMSSRKLIFVVGQPRSGTTWIKEVLSRHLNCCEYHEIISKLIFTLSNQVEITVSDQTILRLLTNTYRDLLDGKQCSLPYDYWWEQPVITSRNTDLIIIKEISRLDLVLQAINKLPSTSLFLTIVMRNPFFNSISIYNHGLSMTETDSVLFQNDKYDLTSYPISNEVYSEVDAIAKFSTDEALNFCQIRFLRWCLNTYSIIKLVLESKIANTLFFYETLCSKHTDFLKVLRVFDETAQLDEKLVIIPSHTTNSRSLIVNGKSPINGWKQDLSKEFLEWGNKVLYYYGLHTVYNSMTFLPNPRIVTLNNLITEIKRAAHKERFNEIMGSVFS